MTEPCPTCPWRKASTVGGADIPRFDIDMMRGLRNTVGDGDAFRPIMACHYSQCGAERACVGYLIQHGYSNLAVRVGLMNQTIEPWPDVEDLDFDLWDDFGEMLVAYEEAHDDDHV